MDLATRFNGEIINGDAMQMYRGLPIITNQIPVQERNGIPHHLISCVDLESEPWRIGIFKEKCLQIIRDIHLRGKLPILVGGTHYYTQAVLFKDQLVREPDRNENFDSEGQLSDSAGSSSEKWPILNAPTPVVLQKLREVDPVMADRWHPNETRKIRRSLEIFFQTGKPASDIYSEQKERRRQVVEKDSHRASDESSTGPLNFRSLIFWVHTDRETLNSRLDARVGAMFEQGLMSETEKMLSYVQERQSQGVRVDETRGVWVSIGFKELKPYFITLSQGSSSKEDLDALKNSCVESIKTATRQYAVSQVKWIRNKFWRALIESNMTPCFYLLDSSNVAAWKVCITQPSESLVHSFLKSEPLPNPKSISESARIILGAKEAQTSSNSSDIPKCITCDVCRKTMINEEQWKIHINGHAHKRALKAMAKKKEREKFLRDRCSLQNSQACVNKED